MLYFQLPMKKGRTNDMGKYSTKQAAGAQRIETLGGGYALKWDDETQMSVNAHAALLSQFAKAGGFLDRLVETCPIRAQGQALGASIHWVFAALVALFFPMAAERFAPSVIFGFFGVMMVLHLLWVLLVVKETKGSALR